MKPPLSRRALAGCVPSLLCTAVLVALASSPALAAPASGDTFVLGTVHVVGKRKKNGDEQVAAKVSRDDIRRFDRRDVAEALGLLSGVTLSTNSRNEKTIAVRGFDSRQVPLFIDGIPVYVPYDGYVDFGRFTTADLAAIQVAKGFSSVAYGPNALGGAINLVSRRPSREFEGDVSAGAGSSGGFTSSANLGSNQGRWYVQGGLSQARADSFPLSSDFVPTPTEDGGERNNADHRDRKLSLKFGLTPDSGDEYAISYYRQEGRKGQPPSTIPAAARYWRWPFWDKESLYFVSNTALGAHETLKLRAFHDRFDNEVDSYTDSSYSRLLTSGRGSVSTGRSIYHDRSNGVSVDLESLRFTAQTLRLVGHFKTDAHRELDGNGQQNAHFEDRLASLGAEDEIALAETWHLNLGLAYHRLQPETVFSRGNPYSLPETQSASNHQLGLFHDYSPTARFYATVARKSRLPTLKDRYSQRLGTYIENPDLRAERSLNYEICYRGEPWQGATAEAALFASDVRDRIQAVAGVSGTLSQMQNVGEVRAKGVELGLRTRLGERTELGGNYTYIDMDNRSDPATRLTDVPRHKAVLHLGFRPIDALELIAFAEHNSSRWASNTVSLDGFTTINAKVSWRLRPTLTLDAGLLNATDRNYTLADGFPSPGRSWLANLHYQF